MPAFGGVRKSGLCACACVGEDETRARSFQIFQIFQMRFSYVFLLYGMAQVVCDQWRSVEFVIPSCSTSSRDWWISHCPMMQPKPESQTCKGDMTKRTCLHDRLNMMLEHYSNLFEYVAMICNAFHLLHTSIYFLLIASMRCMPWRTISKESFPQQRSACQFCPFCQFRLEPWYTSRDTPQVVAL